MLTPAAREDRAARRSALLTDFTAEQITKVTRGLTLAAYAMAYKAGANRNSELELDDALARYMNRGTKTQAHEGAWFDGNTHGDGYAEDHLRERIDYPEAY